MKEYKVGQIVTINGTKTRVTKKDNTLCTGCIFKKYSPLCERYCCGHLERSDHNDVIFAPLPSTHKALNKETGVFTHKEENSALDESKHTEFQLPPENLRVWIRGNKERGEEVIKTLTDLGGINTYSCAGRSNDIYFIDQEEGKNEINRVYDNTPLGRLIINFYKEIKLPWKPKDKELVWCWDTTYTCGKLLKFYDGKHRDTYRFNGMRDGMRYKHYAPYKGEYPQWAKDAQKRLED